MAEICRIWQDREVMGEFVLVVAGAEPLEEAADMDEVRQHLVRLMRGGMKHKAAAKEVAAMYGLPAGDVYALGVEVKEELRKQDD